MPYPDGTLLRIPIGTVYFLDGGQLRGIPDLRTFDVLGFTWPEVKNVSDTEIATLPMGPSYPPLTSRLPRNPATTVFALQRGKRRGFPDLPTLVAFLQTVGWSINEVTDVSDAVIALIPDGGAFPHLSPLQDYCFVMWAYGSSPNQPTVSVGVVKFQARSDAEARNLAESHRRSNGYATYSATQCM